MDTSKLKIGQKVWVRSGDERIEVMVIEVAARFIGLLQGLEGDNSIAFRVEPTTGKQPEGNDPYFQVQVRNADAFLRPGPYRGKSGEPWELVEGPLEKTNLVAEKTNLVVLLKRFFGPFVP